MDPKADANDNNPSLLTDSDGFAPLDHTLFPENEHRPEHLIERIISAGRGEDETMRYHVRWFGYTPEEDTWQEPQTIPANSTARYWRKSAARSPAFLRGQRLDRKIPKRLPNRLLKRLATRQFARAPIRGNKASPQATPEKDLRRPQGSDAVPRHASLRNTGAISEKHKNFFI
ncbi:unnamed protein product [Agarophyton chilense]